MKKNYLKGSPKLKFRHPGTIEDYFFLTGCILAALLTAAAAVSFFMPGLWQNLQLPPCLFHLITGYYCPGCGGTRAVRALLKGRLLLSAYYHPFVPYTAALYLYFMITQIIERVSRGKLTIGMHYHSRYLWIALAVITGSFLLKNILHHFYGFVL